MKMQWVATVATSCALVMGAVGFAGPASAEDVWEMPDVEDMILDQAMDDILAVADPVELKISTNDTKGSREQIHMENWTVCWQWPEAGDEISQRGKSVSLGVKRATDPDCWR